MTYRSDVPAARAALALLFAVLATAATYAQTEGPRTDIVGALRGLVVSDDRQAWHDAERALLYEPVAAFTPEAVGLLGQLMTREEITYYPGLIQVVGAVGDARMLDAIPAEYLEHDLTRQTVTLARIRQGDKALSRKLVETLRRIALDDEYVTRLLPDLIYTRSRPVFDHLYQQMAAAQRSCRSLNPYNDEPLDCGYLLAPALGQATEDFPVAIDFEGLFEAEDVPAALARVRKWYAAHVDTYVIDDTYIR